MSSPYGSDAYAPSEIAERIEAIGVAKARMPLLRTSVLGVLAGGFIGLGSLGSVLVQSDTSLSFAVARVLGGLVFWLGLILVIVAGAELFTGNNLLVMAWADGKVTTRELLRNWVVVCCANFVGAAGLALLVYGSGHAELNEGRIAEAYVRIAAAKCALSMPTAFVRGVLCNMLVCLAVWMAMAGRSVVDKVVVVVFPVTVFVAAGFEHSIANMYLLPMGLLLSDSTAAGAPVPTIGGMFANLLAVIAGNLVGGSGLVALVYFLAYRAGEKRPG